MKLYTELFSLDDHFHCKDPKLGFLGRHVPRYGVRNRSFDVYRKYLL